MLRKAQVILFVLFTLLSSGAFAEEDAPALNPISSLDWNYFFDHIDISIQSCVCQQTSGNDLSNAAGFQFSIVEPIAFIDVTNEPWNFPSLGFQFDDSPDRSQGNSYGSQGDGGDHGGFRYTHFVIYPIFSLLNYVQDYFCFEKFNALDLLFMSEILPNTKLDFIGAFIHPIRLLLSNPIAQIAGGLDCLFATSGSTITNAFAYVSGCNGMIGTGTNYIQGERPPNEAALVAGRMLDTMHYAWALTKTSKSQGMFSFDGFTALDSTCHQQFYPEIIKTQYALQLAYPTVWDAQKIGTLPLWENFKNKPWTQDDFVFAVWRKRDYCAGAYKCESTFNITE